MNIQELLRDWEKIKEKKLWEPEINTEAKSNLPGLHHIFEFFPLVKQVHIFLHMEVNGDRDSDPGDRVEMASQEGKTS